MIGIFGMAILLMTNPHVFSLSLIHMNISDVIELVANIKRFQIVMTFLINLNSAPSSLV